MKKLLILVSFFLTASLVSPQNGVIPVTLKADACRSHAFINGSVSTGTASGQGSAQRSPSQITDTICDTLHYPLPGTVTYYFLSSPNSGYITGNNSFGDLAKADYFQVRPTMKYVTSVVYGFAIAKNTSGTDRDITFALWDATGTGGSPGAMMASQTLKLSMIVSDVSHGYLTLIIFNQPVNITGSFYAGVILPTVTGDTLALYCNTDGDVTPGTAWEMWSDNSWHAFSANESWRINVMEAIFPVLCSATSIDGNEPAGDGVFVYPNPTTGRVQIGAIAGMHRTAVITLYNSSGLQIDRILPSDNNNHLSELDLSGYDPGLYFMRLQLDDRVIMKKILLIR
jgi:hypothetical protein